MLRYATHWLSCQENEKTESQPVGRPGQNVRGFSGEGACLCQVKPLGVAPRGADSTSAHEFLFSSRETARLAQLDHPVETHLLSLSLLFVLPFLHFHLLLIYLSLSLSLSLFLQLCALFVASLTSLSLSLSPFLLPPLLRLFGPCLSELEKGPCSSGLLASGKEMGSILFTSFLKANIRPRSVNQTSLFL